MCLWVVMVNPGPGSAGCLILLKQSFMSTVTRLMSKEEGQNSLFHLISKASSDEELINNMVIKPV